MFKTNIRTEETEARVPDKEILVKINEQVSRKTISVSDKKWERNKRVFVRRALLGVWVCGLFLVIGQCFWEGDFCTQIRR